MNEKKKEPSSSILIEYTEAKTELVEVKGLENVPNPEHNFPVKVEGTEDIYLFEKIIEPGIYEIIDAFGKEEEESIIVPDEIKLEIKFEHPQNSHVIFQLIKGFISVLATTDPTRVHYDIVRATLKRIDEGLLNNTMLIDLMARSLVEHCHKLNLSIKTPSAFKSLLEKAPQKKENFSPESGRVAPYLKITKVQSSPKLEEQFEKNGIFLWDHAFLIILKRTGKNGTSAAEEYKESFKRRLEQFKSEGKSPLHFWFNTESPTPENPFHISPALKILTNCIYEDIIRKRIEFRERNEPAFTTSVQQSITKMLSPKNQVIEKEKSIQLFHQESLLGSIQVPTISQKIVASVFNGVKKLNTVTGHRVMRYFPQSAFDQMINGEADYRVLKLDRGATDIAERLGLRINSKAVSNVKEIIHAMAYFEFLGPELTGNLIQLSKYKSPITGRQDEGYLITVGTPLLPYRTFEDGGLLIPLLKDPPLVNPNQFHAAQYLLQMLLMEEFSKQSVRLAQEGVVLITPEQWKQSGQLCGLTEEVLKKVKERWLKDGDDGAKFLEKVDGDFYTLGQEHAKVSSFLVEQGKLRLRQSCRGKKAAIKREKAKS